ncbi:oxygenase MpaB family protein [Streptomyces sp. NPDC001941]|uniref:oxygenase MpaB family protein n=1 Tax=Streptomyces sp. NPDC001941 TaxID=3154659 RepID=UPI0033188AAF
MNLSGTTTAWPTRRAGRATVLAQFGAARTDLLHWALTTGDPLADAAAEEMHALGMRRARALFARGVREGLEALEDAPPALSALLAAAQSVPAYVDDDLLDTGSSAYFSSPASVHIVSLSAGSLVRVYESPSIATVLAASGRFVDDAGRRIQETGRWLLKAMLPGSLRRGAPGYVATLEVRMLHAHMRRHALERGYDAEAFGTPVNQVDLARTWMDFTLTAFTTEEALGQGLSRRETASLYRYWWYVGHLLGIDSRLIEGIADNTAARRLDDVLQAVTGPLPPEAAVLTDATLRAVSDELRELLHVPPYLSRPFLDAITRRTHGDAVCQDLGVPARPVAGLLLAATTATLRRRRERYRADPAAWRTRHAGNLQEVRQFLAEAAEPTAFERGATSGAD